MYLNCHTQFGSHVTNYDITISKKGIKMYCTNTISFPLDVWLNISVQLRTGSFLFTRAVVAP